MVGELAGKAAGLSTSRQLVRNTIQCCLVNLNLFAGEVQQWQAKLLKLPGYAHAVLCCACRRRRYPWTHCPWRPARWRR